MLVRKSRRWRIVVTVGLVLGVFLAIVLTGTANAAGVSQWNKPMCESNAFEYIKTAQTEYAATDSAGTCVSAERYAGDIDITSVTNLSYQFPAIDSGYVPMGEPTCASARDACWKYPVRQEYDGTPVVSLGAWLNPGQWKLAIDTWFSPAEGDHDYAGRKGDTEVMIWLSHPGESIPAADCLGYNDIDGIRFCVDSWMQDSGVRYVAYVAMTGPGSARTVSAPGQRVSWAGLWLNPFWRNAEANGWLGKSEWLWAVDTGFELTKGGKGDNIHGYTLADMVKS
jgi:hypothetical protein